MSALLTDISDSIENRFEGPLSSVAQALFELATDKAVRIEAPDIGHYLDRFLSALIDKKVDEKSYEEALEAALAGLYSRLHRAGQQYSPEEKKALKEIEGYSCIAGGISPLIAARPFIGPDSVVADLGAGNGLQGLLLQRIRPHRRTVQIELSSELIRTGRIYQKALGMDQGLIEWINDDISNVSLEAADVLYIYRPAKPHGPGRDFYGMVARKISEARRPRVILSVADCLSEFLDENFSVFYSDGHLTCYRPASP